MPGGAPEHHLDRRPSRPEVPWFAEPVDEAERLAATGWSVGADRECDEPDTYTDEELEAWGYGPSTPERRGRWPACPRAAATAVVSRGLGQAVAGYRRRRGWTQRVLARRLGIDQPRVSRLERGRVRTVTVEQLTTLALETGLTVTVRIAPAPERGCVRGGELRVLDAREAVLPSGGEVRLVLDAPALVSPSQPGVVSGRGAWGIP